MQIEITGGIPAKHPVNMNTPQQNTFEELRNGALPPMKTKVPRHSRTKSIIEPDQIFKQLQKYASNTSSQFALLMCDAKGKHHVVSSNAFSGYLDNWIPINVRKQASQVSVSVAEEKAVRRRRDSGIDRREMQQERKQEPDEEEEDVDWPEEDPIMPTMRRGKEMEGYHGEMLLPAPPPDDMAIRKRSQDETQTPRKKKSVPRRQVEASSSESGDYPECTGNPTYKPLKISDNDAVTTFYMTRLRQMQQLMCKVVSKAWIKVIEPKKQSNFPYNRGDESKPSWWPRDVRHKEPDHLMKPERLTLLLTMLRSQKVPIQKLESATAEVMVQIPNERIPLLEEIYRVAKQEERANRGELPPDFVVFVAASEKIIKKSPRVSGRKSVTPNLRRRSIHSPISGIGSSAQSDRRHSVQSSTPDMVEGQEIEMQGSSSRMGGQDDSNQLQRVQPPHNPFSGSSVQPVIPSLARPIDYNTAYVPQTSPIQAPPQQQQGFVPDLGGYFIVDQPPQAVAQQRHSVSFSGPSGPHGPLRRNHSMPAPPTQTGGPVYNNWSSQHQLGTGMYASYSPSNPQPQHSPHGVQHGNAQSASTPSTPATAGSFQLPPPPPPPHATVAALHQQGQISAQGSHHEMSGIERRPEHQYALGTQIRQENHPTFTDFLQSDLASVQENSTDENNGRLK